MMPLVRQEGEIIDLILKIFDLHEICERFIIPNDERKIKRRNLP